MAFFLTPTPADPPAWIPATDPRIPPMWQDPANPTPAQQIADGSWYPVAGDVPWSLYPPGFPTPAQFALTGRVHYYPTASFIFTGADEEAFALAHGYLTEPCDPFNVVGDKGAVLEHMLQLHFRTPLRFVQNPLASPTECPACGLVHQPDAGQWVERLPVASLVRVPIGDAWYYVFPHFVADFATAGGGNNIVEDGPRQWTDWFGKERYRHQFTIGVCWYGLGTDLEVSAIATPRRRTGVTSPSVVGVLLGFGAGLFYSQMPPIVRPPQRKHL